MKPLTLMLIAGDPSGDLAAADLVRALRSEFSPWHPRFIGAGGPAMRNAGVVLRHELTGHSVIGLEILRRLADFRRIFRDLHDLADAELPDAIVGVDYSGFNLRFAAAVRTRVRRRSGIFQNWRPRLIQYISPQVWASRAGRARQMEQTHDLLLSILPFEPAWYAQHAPRLPVVFVGHPLVDRRRAGTPPETPIGNSGSKPLVVLLPGSRAGELHRHLPVMVPAAATLVRETGAEIRIVVPDETLAMIADSYLPQGFSGRIQLGRLDDALGHATLALASTGTVTLECAWFGVPTVAMYKTSPLTYQVGRRIITVPYLAMPNLMAKDQLIPELIQDEATPASLASAALELLRDPPRCDSIRSRLLQVARSLGAPGASERAAQAIRIQLSGIAIGS